jgi:uncharacterized protein (DUF2384 family)
MHVLDSKRILALAHRVLGGPAAAEWLNRPNIQLGGRSPRELIRTEDGLRRVEELLTQLDDDNRSSRSRD